MMADMGESDIESSEKDEQKYIQAMPVEVFPGITWAPIDKTCEIDKCPN